MEYPSKSACILALHLLAAVGSTGLTYGAVAVLIQPSGDGAKTYFTVSWNSLEGGVDLGMDTQTLGNPVNHSPAGEAVVIWLLWSEFGDYKSSITNDVFLGSGSPDYISDPAGFGLYLDDDFEDKPGDDFGIIYTGASFPSSGSFLAETATYTSGFLAMWKPGVHSGPAGSTIEVTTTAFVPEPSSPVLLGLAAMILSHHRSRRKWYSESRDQDTGLSCRVHQQRQLS